MSEKKYKVGYFEDPNPVDDYVETIDGEYLNATDVVKLLNKLSEENEKLKKYNKGQELEIIRLHNLADTMSAVLRELGIYDVYNDEQIENVKRRIINE